MRCTTGLVALSFSLASFTPATVAQRPDVAHAGPAFTHAATLRAEVAATEVPTWIAYTIPSLHPVQNHLENGTDFLEGATSPTSTRTPAAPVRPARPPPSSSSAWPTVESCASRSNTLPANSTPETSRSSSSTTFPPPTPSPPSPRPSTATSQPTPKPPSRLSPSPRRAHPQPHPPPAKAAVPATKSSNLDSSPSRSTPTPPPPVSSPASPPKPPSPQTTPSPPHTIPASPPPCATPSATTRSLIGREAIFWLGRIDDRRASTSSPASSADNSRSAIA